MRDRSTRARAAALGVALAGLAGCAPAATRPPAPPSALPPIPAVRGPLRIRVVEPRSGEPLPRVDSLALYGSVGTGRARLTINGVRVPVEPNGAFIAFLPLPDSGVFHLAARAGRRRDTATIALRLPPAPAATPAAPRPAP